MKVIKFIFSAFFLFAAGSTNAQVGIKSSAMGAYSFLSSKAFAMHLLGGDTTYRIIFSEGKTYGYDIIVYKRLLVHQPTIPGISGSKGFERKSDAEKVARLVIKKLQKGMMPPTVEKKELDSLKIKY